MIGTSTLRIRGNVFVEVHDLASGKVARFEASNLVVDQGLNLLRDLLADVGFAPKKMAVGTSGNAPVASITALGAEVFRADITRRSRTAKKVSFQLFLATTDANGNTLRECGLFDGNGKMWAMAVFPAGQEIVKTSSIEATITHEVSVST